MNDPQRSRPQVTLEDLLRVKRSERPPPEFWSDFERTLRAKQLAAIVEKRPWWRSWKNFSRWSLPVSAAAAFGVTMITFQGTAPVAHQPASPAEAAPARQSLQVVQATTSAPLTESAPVEREVASLPEPLPALADVHVVASATPAMPAEAAPVAPSPARRPAQVASVSEQIAGVAAAPELESSVTARFANVDSPFTSPAADLGAFFERAVAQIDEGLRPHRQPSLDPLAQLPTPGDARRARLLAFTRSVDSKAPQYTSASNVIRSRERITSHLNDEALYDSIRRMGVQGNGVSIQF